MQRCGVCKDTHYCGAACQKADWKQHKKTCSPPLRIEQVNREFDQAVDNGDWRAVIKFEPRIDEMLKGHNFIANYMLRSFASAHEQGYAATGDQEHLHATIRLEKRRVALTSMLEAYKDQGAALCSISVSLNHLQRREEAATYLQRARNLAEKHFLFAVESDACAGLGELAMLSGRLGEAVALLRNALTCAMSTYADQDLRGSRYEGNALLRLIQALFRSNIVSMDTFFHPSSALDELDPLVPRYRKLAEEMSRKDGCLRTAQLRSMYFTALLHEVVSHCLTHSIYSTASLRYLYPAESFIVCTQPQFSPPQAYARPQESAREVRAMLDIMRKHKNDMQDNPRQFLDVLTIAGKVEGNVGLKILNPMMGNLGLIEEWAAQTTEVRMMVVQIRR